MVSIVGDTVTINVVVSHTPLVSHTTKHKVSTPVKFVSGTYVTQPEVVSNTKVPCIGGHKLSIDPILSTTVIEGGQYVIVLSSGIVVTKVSRTGTIVIGINVVSHTPKIESHTTIQMVS
jgi:hypothetical protein